MQGILSEYAHLITDPAHSLVEFTFVLLDYLVIQVVVRGVKKHFHRDLRREHTVLDTEHGITHHEEHDGSHDHHRPAAALRPPSP